MSWSIEGAAAVATLMIGPHLIPRRALRPVVGIALWTSVLVLRAVVSIAGAVVSVLYLPSTPPFQAINGWCIHAGIPFVADHFGISGHALGDAASFMPAIMVLAIAASAGYGIWKAIRTASAWLGRSALGDGPSESVIVGDREVIVATTGIRKPTVVVSAGALLNLDDAELAAGLAHEWGHVRRGHRVLTFVSAVLLGVSRLLPGGKRAFEDLQFHVERDADHYAVRRTGDPLALASAICKTAVGGVASSSLAMASLAGANTAERLRLLLERNERAGTRRTTEAIAAVLIAIDAFVAATLLVTLPGLLFASAVQAHVSIDQLRDCLG